MTKNNEIQAALDAVDVLTPHGNPDYNRGFNDCKAAAKVNISAALIARAEQKAEV